jgi:hypothetical protein
LNLNSQENQDPYAESWSNSNEDGKKSAVSPSQKKSIYEQPFTPQKNG